MAWIFIPALLWQDPYPLFPTHYAAWKNDRVFHSLFAPAASDGPLHALDLGFLASMLLMREYIVYHTNQAYPEYLVHFKLV